MNVEFDPAKDTVNRDKQGVSLTFGARVFDDAYCFIIDTARKGDGEDRFKAVGIVDGRHWRAVTPIAARRCD